MKKRSSLLSQFAIIFTLFALVTIGTSMLVTYLMQMNSYREENRKTIEVVGGYLSDLILEDSKDFREYTAFYKEHAKDMLIPIDFDEYDTARGEFEKAFADEYPGLAFKVDVQPSEMPYELQLLYYTYRQEYWILTFEQTRDSFGLTYTYFLTMNDKDYTSVYQIDAVREPSEEYPDYLNLGDAYFEDPEVHVEMWETWEKGLKLDRAEEWDNEYGNTYGYYTPLVINGRKVGLVVGEIDVAKVNSSILTNTIKLGLRIAGIFFIGIILVLFIINNGYISRILYLADRVDSYGKTRDPQIIDDIREYSFGNNEIALLAEETADMISEIDAHENEVEKAAKMKTDFLANMSHEIRTPMNAVIGMAEMALREKIPDAARNYIGQIKSSGRVLLTIINDILDFSKIESGKMEIIPADYVPMSLFNDVSNIIMMRIGEKDVALDLNIPPTLPALLNGDNIRIRQILINLANNAVKFTQEGHIAINVSYEKTGDSTIMLSVAVEDTGMGIKEEDLNKIFESFSQVDSKRNRSVEGTGLGLAISQRLVSLMDGELDVTSEYGKGSTFSFRIPQVVAEWTPGMVVSKPEECVGISLLSDEGMTERFTRDSRNLNVTTYQLNPDVNIVEQFDEYREKYPDCTFFVFTDEEQMNPDRTVFLGSEPDIVVVMVTEFNDRCDMNLPNLVQLKKPLSAMNISMIYNREKVYFDMGLSDDEGEFIAPDATILIVDDNAVNLAVAEGLLEPLKMSVMTATSAKEAIALTAKNKYDIIFMDHMMPEMDGVEATQVIREKYPDYADSPIIALTANAIGEAREQFLKAGLNDFVAKPIEVHNLITKVREWLPSEKIQYISADEAAAQDANDGAVENASPVIGDLDTASAISMIGSEKVFYNILKEYHRVMESKSEAIRSAYTSEDWSTYTIEVHALKSSSRQIGAMELADMAAELEAAGKELNTELIKQNTDTMLERYMSYKPVLDPIFNNEENGSGDKPRIEKDVLTDTFAKIKTAADELDLDALEEAAELLDAYSYPEDEAEYLARLKTAIGSIDTDECLNIIEEWEAKI